MAKAEDFDAIADRITTDIGKIRDDIARIKEQSGGIKPEDLDAPLAKLTAVADALDALDAENEPPAAPAS